MLLTLGLIHKSHIVNVEQKELFAFTFFLDVFLFVVMIGFNSWNWYLGCIGITSIEYWTSKIRDDNVKGKLFYDFSFQKVSDNIYMLFGTNKIVRVLSPSMRNVPFTGLEWAYLMRD